MVEALLLDTGEGEDRIAPAWLLALTVGRKVSGNSFLGLYVGPFAFLLTLPA